VVHVFQLKHCIGHSIAMYLYWTFERFFTGVRPEMIIQQGFTTVLLSTYLIKIDEKSH